MVLSNMAQTRDEAVAYARKLEQELRLFRHVTGDHTFADDTLFYRLRFGAPFEGMPNESHPNDDGVSATSNQDCLSATSEQSGKSLNVNGFKSIIGPLVRDRRYRASTYSAVFVGAEAVDQMVYSGFAKNRKEAVHIARQIAKENDLFNHVTNDHAFCDDFLFFKFNSDANQGVPSTHDADGDDTSQQLRSDLGEKADTFKGIVDVRDRTFRMKKYRRSFIGAEAVDAMLYQGMASTREEGIKIGQELQSELRLFRKLGGNSLLADDYLFYRLRDDDNESVSSDLTTSTGSGSRTSSMDLIEMSEKFRGCTVVRDRRFRLMTYKQCFVGCGTYFGLLHLRKC